MEDKYVSIRKKPWKDLQDNDFVYKEGDIYPREGLKVSKKRIQELSGNKNKLKEPLIKKLEETDDNEEKTEE